MTTPTSSPKAGDLVATIIALSGRKSVFGSPATSPLPGTTAAPGISLATRQSVFQKVTAAPPTGATATVQLSTSSLSVNAGGNFTLTWSSQLVDTVTASGAWAGSLAVSGSMVIHPTVVGTYTYTIMGASAYSSSNASITVNVTSSSGQRWPRATQK